MNRIARTMCWILAWVFPLSVSAAERDAAMLSTHGSVTVNGTLAPVSYLVRAGDRIVTEAHGAASLLAPGASLLIPGGSSIRYGPQVEMAYGAVVINATAASRMKARLGNISVTPSGTFARFQLTSTDGKFTVAALDGALNVTDGTHSMMLRAGQMLSSGPAGQGGQGGATGGSTTASGIPGWVIAVIAVGAVAAAAGVIGVVTSSGNPSQSRP